MQRWHDAGDPVLIPSQFVEEFKFSEWFNRWHGGSIAIPPDASLRLTSVPSTKDKIFQVKLLTPNGNVAATRNTIMRVIKRGATEITYTNEHCPTPFRCQLVLRTEKRGVHFTFDIWATGSKTTIQETKQNLPFYKAISLGGTLQITPKDIKSVVKSPTYSSTLTPIEFPILDVEINRLLDRCAYIESKTGARLTLSDLRLTEQDVEDIEYLMTVLQAGHIIREFNVLPLTLTPRPSENGESVLILAQALLETDKSGIPFPISLEVGEVEGYFVGAKISLGPAKNHILGRLAPESREQLQKYIQDPKSVKEMEVVLFDAQMTEEYGDWLPKAFDSDIAPSLT